MNMTWCSVQFINKDGRLLAGHLEAVETVKEYEPGKSAFVGGWINKAMLVTDLYVRGDILLKGFPGVSKTLFAPVQVWVVVEDAE